MKTEIQVDIRYQWSRTHSPKHKNYLLIEQKAQLIIKGQNNKGTSIKIKDNKIEDEIYKDYETESISPVTRSDDYSFIKDSMEKSNIATNDYEYFRVIFANGFEIVCKTFKEFEDIVSKSNK